MWFTLSKILEGMTYKQIQTEALSLLAWTVVQVAQMVKICLQNRNPLQYSCLENPMGRGDWQAPVLVVTGLDMAEHLTLCFFLLCPCPQMWEFHIPDRVSLSLGLNIFRAKLHFGGKSYWTHYRRTESSRDIVHSYTHGHKMSSFAFKSLISHAVCY